MVQWLGLCVFTAEVTGKIHGWRTKISSCKPSGTAKKKKKGENSAHRLIKARFFSHSVMSDSLWPHGLQHARLPCPSPTPRACSNTCPLSRWCHPTVSSSVILFSSCLQSFPASGSFPVSQFFTTGAQSIGVSDSASVLPMNIQDWFPLGLTGLLSLPSKGLSRVFSNTTVPKHQFFSFLYSPTLMSIHYCISHPSIHTYSPALPPYMVESSDRTWSTGEGNGKPLQYSCH